MSRAQPGAGGQALSACGTKPTDSLGQADEPPQGAERALHQALAEIGRHGLQVHSRVSLPAS